PPCRGPRPPAACPEPPGGGSPARGTRPKGQRPARSRGGAPGRDTLRSCRLLRRILVSIRPARAIFCAACANILNYIDEIQECRCPEFFDGRGGPSGRPLGQAARPLGQEGSAVSVPRTGGRLRLVPALLVCRRGAPARRREAPFERRRTVS